MSDESTSENANQPSAARRRKARTLALQALYQWQLAKSSVAQIEAEFAVDNDMSKVDVAYFRDILHGVTSQKSELEAHFSPFLDRPVNDVDPIELSLLRMGAYELMKRVDVPYRVVINEGVELAKKFGGTDGHKFINGILDKMALRLRAPETRHKPRQPKAE